MIGFLAGVLLFGYFGIKEWEKNKNITVEGLLNCNPEIEPAKKEVDLVSLLEQVDKGSIVIKELIEVDDWFKCDDRQKISVVNEGNKTSINIHLPNYTKRDVEYRTKITDYIRCVGNWKKSLGYRDAELLTKLVVYTEGEDNCVDVSIVPENITEGFGDDKDPRGINRTYEALVNERNKNHEEAENAINDFLEERRLIKAEVLISVIIRNIDNNDLGEILKTPLVIESIDGNIETENILFCSELGSFYDFNDEGTIEDYAMGLEDFNT